jgi:hypothetical protein
MLEIILAVLNASTLIMVAVIQNTNTKNKKVEEERYQRRLEHEDLTMCLIQCDVQMSMLSARKQAGEHINGDLEKAINATECAYAAYVDFARKEFAGSVSKI